METIKIVKEFDNPLFGRKEIEVLINSKISPKKEQAEELISRKFSIDKDKIRIKKIQGKFGSNEFKIIASLYSSKDALKKIEFFSKKELEKIKKAQEAEKNTADADVKKSDNKENEIVSD